MECRKLKKNDTTSDTSPAFNPSFPTLNHEFHNSRSISPFNPVPQNQQKNQINKATRRKKEKRENLTLYASTLKKKKESTSPQKAPEKKPQNITRESNWKDLKRDTNKVNRKTKNLTKAASKNSNLETNIESTKLKKKKIQNPKSKTTNNHEKGNRETQKNRESTCFGRHHRSDS